MAVPPMARPGAGTAPDGAAAPAEAAWTWCPAEGDAVDFRNGKAGGAWEAATVEGVARDVGPGEVRQTRSWPRSVLSETHNLVCSGSQLPAAAKQIVRLRTKVGPAKLAQRQSFDGCVFPQEYAGQLLSFGPT